LADVDFRTGEVRHDVRAGATGDCADVDRGGTEDGIGVGGEGGLEVFLEDEQGAGELEDRVVAELRLRGMRRRADGGEGRPQRAFRDADDVH